MAKRTKITVSIAPSTMERLRRFCEEHDGISQGDVVDDALKNFFEKQDRNHSAPDLVLDRINQMMLSLMQANQTLGEIKDKIDLMEDG